MGAGWTKGYTMFAQDLPFNTTPEFEFPGRHAEKHSLNLVTDYGSVNTGWICQGPLNGYYNPPSPYRCRIALPGYELKKNCLYCKLRFTNPSGEYISVWHVRLWTLWVPSLNTYMIYFNSDNSIQDIRAKFPNNTAINVTWDDVSQPPEDNLGISFVHGRSEEARLEGRSGAKMRFGLAGNYQRDFNVFGYINYPNLVVGDVFRTRQYYITDRYSNLEEKSTPFVEETIEERMQSGALPDTSIYLHESVSGNTFGASIDNPICINDSQETTLVCTGSSTPQPNKLPLLQITCGSTTYVGSDFYYFTNYPTVPYRTYVCRVGGTETSDRPSVKLLGYFNGTECNNGNFQSKTYDSNLCDIPSESSLIPSNLPSVVPSNIPPTSLSIIPSDLVPSNTPSTALSNVPSDLVPSNIPSTSLSIVPSDLVPSNTPSTAQSIVPSDLVPSYIPSTAQSIVPSDLVPSNIPSTAQSIVPSDLPSITPSNMPAIVPPTDPPSPA